MTRRLEQKILKEESIIARLKVRLNKHRARLERLQKRLTQVVRGASTSSSSSSSARSSATSSRKVPRLAIADGQPSLPEPVENKPDVASGRADSRDAGGAAVPPTADGEHEERKALLLQFVDESGKPTGGECYRCQRWLSGKAGGVAHLFDPGKGCLARKGRKDQLSAILSWLEGGRPMA